MSVTNRVLGAGLAGIAALLVPCALAWADPPAQEVRSAAEDEEPNFVFDAAASGGWYAITSDPPGAPNTSGNQEGLSMSLTAFQTPLHDDDAPYTLQPFMQRESTFTFSLNGGRFDTANPYGGVDKTQWSTGLGASFNVFVKRWLIVFGDASYEHFDLRDADGAQTSQGFSGDAGVALRHRDSRVAVSVGGAVDRAAGAFGSWRRDLTLSAYTVIDRRLELEVAGTLVPGGEEGSVEAELFPSKGTGVFASAFAGHFEPYSDPVFATRYVGAAGFAGWFDASTALVGQYSLTEETDPAVPQVTAGYRALTHALSLQAYFRFP